MKHIVPDDPRHPDLCGWHGEDIPWAKTGMEEIVESVQNLVQVLKDLAKEEPDKFYGTPYQDLHDRLDSALESYYEAKRRRG